MIDKKKKELGQFFTKTNIFDNKIFKKWLKKINPNKIIEPFAGNKNIPNLIEQLKIKSIEWEMYDIEPIHNDIIKNDSLKNMPKGDIYITNPPYLSKTTATKNDLKFLFRGLPDFFVITPTFSTYFPFLL